MDGHQARDWTGNSSEIDVECCRIDVNEGGTSSNIANAVQTGDKGERGCDNDFVGVDPADEGGSVKGSSAATECDGEPGTDRVGERPLKFWNYRTLCESITKHDLSYGSEIVLIKALVAIRNSGVSHRWSRSCRICSMESQSSLRSDR